jgi:hypothetical protein
VLGSIIKKNENSFVWEQQKQKRNRWNFEFSSESVCLLRHYKFNVSSILRWTFITDDLFYSNLGKYLFRKNLFWTLHVPISCTYSDFKFVFWRFKKRENNIIHLSPIWSVLGRIPQNFVVKKLTQKNHPLTPPSPLLNVEIVTRGGSHSATLDWDRSSTQMTDRPPLNPIERTHPEQNFLLSAVDWITL